MGVPFPLVLTIYPFLYSIFCNVLFIFAVDLELNVAFPVWNQNCLISSLNSQCVAPTGFLHGSFRNSHLSLSSLLPGHTCTLQSLFLPNTHLSPADFPQIYLGPHFSKRQVILISAPITQIELLVYSHQKICAVNTHFFSQIEV